MIIASPVFKHVSGPAKALLKKISHQLELKHLIIHGVLHLLNYDHDESDDDFLEIEESILGNKIH